MLDGLIGFFLTWQWILNSLLKKLKWIQSYISVCNFVVHERCLKTVVSACSSIATNLIKVRYYTGLEIN